MDNRIISISGVFLTALAGTLLIFWWLGSGLQKDFFLFVPGLDGRPERVQVQEKTTPIGFYFENYQGIPSTLSGQWPRFRGPGYDNTSRDTVPLIDRFPAGGPEILYRIDLGEGHAAPAVSNGCIYILDYDEEKKGDALRCFSLDDGKEIWRRWYPVTVKRNHGMSRTVPAVTERYAVSIGPKCHVMCVDAHTGEFLWGIDLEKEYDATIPQWYTAQCPLIDNDIAVIAPAGKSLLIGVDCASGKIVWETPNSNAYKMSHSSIISATIDGVDMYVYAALGGISGIAARGSEQGKILWTTNAWDNAVIVPSPVILPDGRIFLTAGYGAGGMMIRVQKTEGQFKTEVLYKTKPREGLCCEQQTPVLYNGHLFGILPKDAGPLRTQFVCYHPDGQMIWSSGSGRQFGLGPYLLADGKFFILNDDGVLVIAQATLERYEELDRARILHGRDAWGPLALAGGRLLARDTRQLVCINLSAEKGK
ncbi:MAG: PQQ-binding-like beta-propeller repeat protein [Spirochaetales bacterium]|nr:PQQ-binding-like beta-propeller repeat protein [Spirochaetales bacterium]